MPLCPSCGSENRDKARFCLGCGLPLKETPAGFDDSAYMTTETLQKGQILANRFVIQNLLSSGGMGYVYRATDYSTNSDVAVKEMIDRFTTVKSRQIALSFFRREVELLIHLQHPAIPKVHHYFTENQRSYIVMDLIDGIDMRRMLTRLDETNKALPLEMALQWALEICDVLSYLHNQDPAIIYRDLKPSNLMITPDGNVKLIDFGIARFFAPTVKGTMVGTQGYAPPEQYRGEAEPRSDIYSMGATLHHLLTGRDPQMEAPFDFKPIRVYNPDFPKELEAVVMKALDLDISQRFQTAAHMKEALEKVISASDLLNDLNRQVEAIQDQLEDLRKKRTNILDPYGRLKENHTPGPGKRNEQEESYDTQEWSQFGCNPRKTCNATVTSNLDGHLKWRRKLDTPISSSIILDDEENIYIGTHGGQFHCLDPKGNKRWIQYAQGVISSTGAIDNQGDIFFACEKGYVYCIGNNGEEKWRMQLNNPVKAPLLLNRNSIIAADIEGEVYCMTHDGNACWSIKTGGAIVGSPASDQNGDIYISIITGSIMALGRDGTLHWTFRLPGMITANPVVSADENIYAGCEDGFLYCLDNAGDLLWKFKTGGWIRSGPALYRDGIIYAGSGDKWLYALQKNGAEKWRFDASDKIIASPAVSDEGMIYLATAGGSLYAVHPYGKSKWWFALGDKTEASPVIGKSGKIYIGGSDGYVYAVS